MRFAIVDDMAGARARVLRLLSDFCKQQGLTYTVDSFSSGEEFLDALRILPEQEPLLSFSSNGTTLQLPYSTICSVRSSIHSSILTDMECREYTVSAPFTSFVKPLETKENFLLVSRGILVNLDFVTGFTETECLLQNGASVPITLRRQKQLTQIWRNYEFTKLHRKASEKLS